MFTYFVAIVSASCRVADIQTKRDFDISQYSGTWHEVYYQDKSFYGPDDSWEDYVEIYSLLQNGSMSVVGRGRKPSMRDDDCITLTTATLIPTSDNGKLNLTARGNTRHFWILDTDYTDFSVTYGCRGLDAQGGCTLKDKLDTWVWSRTSTLSSELLIHVKSILRGACVNFEDLTRTSINRV